MTTLEITPAAGRTLPGVPRGVLGRAEEGALAHARGDARGHDRRDRRRRGRGALPRRRRLRAVRPSSSGCSADGDGGRPAVVRGAHVLGLRAQGEGVARGAHPRPRQARPLRRDPGAVGEGRRAGQGQEEDVVAEVLPRLHPGQHAAQQRDLAHRQVDAEGHGLPRRRHRSRTRSRPSPRPRCARSRTRWRRGRSSRSPRCSSSRASR